MILLTASSAALAEACQHSFRPDVAKPPEPETSEEQARGNLVGSLSEAFINGTQEPQWSLADSAGRMWQHLHAWLKENKRLAWKAEAAFLYDPVADHAREIPRSKHRDYSMATETETCAATLDIVSIEDQVLVVRDIKTHAPGAPHMSAAKQLEWCALFACRAWGFDQARIETLVVTELGLTVEDVRHIDMFDLADIRAGIQATLAKIPAAEPRPGDHCTQRWCKLLTTCDRAGRGAPAALAQVIPAEMLARKYIYGAPIESAEQLRWYVEVNAIVKKAQEAASRMATAYVTSREGRVQCEDGSEVYASTRGMPRQDKKALDALLVRLGATGEDIQSTWRITREPAGLKVRTPLPPKGKR